MVNGETFLVSQRDAGLVRAHPEVEGGHAVVGPVQAEDLDRDPELEHRDRLDQHDTHPGQRHAPSIVAEILRTSDPCQWSAADSVDAYASSAA